MKHNNAIQENNHNNNNNNNKIINMRFCYLKQVNEMMQSKKQIL